MTFSASGPAGFTFHDIVDVQSFNGAIYPTNGVYGFGVLRADRLYKWYIISQWKVTNLTQSTAALFTPFFPHGTEIGYSLDGRRMICHVIDDDIDNEGIQRIFK